MELYMTKRVGEDVAQFVLERDCGTCIICGSEDRVQICHVSSRGSRPDLINDPENLCVLCYECHIGRMHNKGTITSYMLQEALRNLYGYHGGSNNG